MTMGSDQLTYLNTAGQVSTRKANPRFKSFKHVFEGLLKSSEVPTPYALVTILMSNDSKVCITVSKADDCSYFIHQYNVESQECTFKELIGQLPPGDDPDIKVQHYIKFKEVEQTSDGQKFAACYNDDGKYRIRVFGRKNRTPAEIAKTEINVNKVLSLDESTMCNAMFPEPFMNCVFIDNDTLFIGLFMNQSRTHHHFIYSLEHDNIIGKPYS